MNRCEHYQELISRMLDGDLSKAERDELAAHVKSCPDCAAVYVAFRSLSENIGGDLVEPPKALHENIMAEVRRDQIRRNNAAHRSHRRWHTVLTVAACLVLVVAAGFSLPRIVLRKGAAAPQAAPVAAEESAAEAEVPMLAAPAPKPEERADGMPDNSLKAADSASAQAEAAEPPAEMPAEMPAEVLEEESVPYAGVVTEREDGTLVLDEEKSLALIGMLTKAQTPLSGAPTHELHLIYLRDGVETPMTILLTERESVCVFADGDSYYRIDCPPDELLAFLEPEG